MSGGSFYNVNGVARAEQYDVLTVAGTSPPVRLSDGVTVQISGTATNIVARVERSSQDPAMATANWAPAEDTGISGDLSAGISPRAFLEPAVGWWRLNITTLTGGNCKVSIVGGKA